MARRFTKLLVTDNKREVRERLYQDILDLNLRAGSFGMLAGEVPDEEIYCIRKRFYRPQIVAFDTKDNCVSAAQACGIEAIKGNLRYAKTWGEREFSVFNLDLCKTLTTEQDVIERVAKSTKFAIAIFVSVRNEVTADESTNGRERVTCGESTTAEERVTRIEPTIESERLSESQRNCITRMHAVVNGVKPAQLVRAYAYRGGLDMVGALFVFRNKPFATLPAFRVAHEEYSHDREYALRTMHVYGKRLKKQLG